MLRHSRAALFGFAQECMLHCLGNPPASAAYLQDIGGEACRLGRHQGQEIDMSSLIAETTGKTRKASWKMALVAGALAATMAGAMPAAAMDQQATDAAKDNSANWQSSAADAYAQAPAPHRSGPYASARPDRPAAVARPHKNFQDYK
jgi:hypothetical protein